MADETRRFRAGTSLPYARALLVLVEQARSREESFDWGPVNVRAMRQHGITVTGPGAVVRELTDLLVREVPGLHQVEE